MSPSRRGAACALLTVLLWSTLGVGLKLAVSRVGGFVATVYIIGLSTIAMYAYLVAVGKAGRIVAHFETMPTFFLATGFVGLGLHQVLYLTGYSLLPASQVVIIHYLWPLTMVVLSTLVFREPTTRSAVGFVILGFLGLYVVISKGTWLRIDLSTGVIIVFCGSFCWALFSVLIKHKAFDVEIGTFLFHVFGLVFLASLIPVFGFTFDITWKELLGFAYLGVFPTALSYILWNHALRLARTSLCSNIVLLMPVLSLVWIKLVLKEVISVWQLIGFAMILGSVFLNLRYGGLRDDGPADVPAGPP
ncbi:MAG: DMT family transporter [Phycisphaerae bacterium]|nr:DMT family transporter [Phycisphaerae bacterium]